MSGKRWLIEDRSAERQRDFLAAEAPALPAQTFLARQNNRSR